MSVVIDFQEYRRKRERERVPDAQPSQYYCWYPVYWMVMIWPPAPYVTTCLIANDAR